MAEPDPDSITAQFRKPLEPRPPSSSQGQRRDWTPSSSGSRPEALPLADYLTRLESSSGSGPAASPRAPSRSTPAPPSWKAQEPPMPGGAGGTSDSTPTVMARAPGAPGDTSAGGRSKKRDLVIFGSVAALVLIAAVVTVLLVILMAD